MSSELKNRSCKPCEDKTGKLAHEAAEKLGSEIDQQWHIFEDEKIEKTFKFANFADALAFVNKVGAIAEKENHHPDIHLVGWNKVTLSLSTHSIGGLSENDFILAAKIDELGR